MNSRARATEDGDSCPVKEKNERAKMSGRKEEKAVGVKNNRLAAPGVPISPSFPEIEMSRSMGRSNRSTVTSN